MSTSTGLRHVTIEGAEWFTLDVHGTMMDKAVIFEGNYDVRSAFFRLPKSEIIHRHTHTKWVQVMVMSGCMRVQQDGSAEFDARPGSVYFLDPNYPHTETALEETVVLVTQGEDRPGWISAEQ